MSIFNFWRKSGENKAEHECIGVADDSMLYLDGFSCAYCHATAHDNETKCFVCGRAYPSRVLEVSERRNEAKWRLVKKMEHGHAAQVLREATLTLAQDGKLSPRKVFSEICENYVV